MSALIIKAEMATAALKELGCPGLKSRYRIRDSVKQIPAIYAGTSPGIKLSQGTRMLVADVSEALKSGDDIIVVFAGPKRKQVKSRLGTRIKIPKRKWPEYVGVIDYIKELLAKASRRKPLSKDQLLSKLVERFPDREPASMKATIKRVVPVKLRRDGFYVRENPMGYWLETPKFNSANPKSNKD